MLSKYEQFINDGSGDNSEFITQMCSEFFNVKLNKDNLWNEGTEIGETDIREGDLLFFESDGTPHAHVGLSLASGKFIHMGTRGLQKSSLNDDRWYFRFDGARRVV